ncbi:MAG: hypothetical protein ACXU9G_07915, partial [Syntrophales bacterium]
KDIHSAKKNARSLVVSPGRDSFRALLSIRRLASKINKTLSVVSSNCNALGVFKWQKRNYRSTNHARKDH